MKKLLLLLSLVSQLLFVQPVYADHCEINATNDQRCTYFAYWAQEAIDRLPLEYRLVLNHAQPRVVTGEFVEANIARYVPLTNTIILNHTLMKESTEVVAASLLHELVHVRQFQLEHRSETECYTLEIEAYREHARFWRSLYGLDGPTRTPTERFYTYMSSLSEEEIQSRVRESMSYQQQCH